MLHLPEFSAGLSCRLRFIFNPDARLVSAMQPVMLVAAYLVRRFRRLESEGRMATRLTSLSDESTFLRCIFVKFGDGGCGICVLWKRRKRVK